jgi:hypothetical protein
MQVSHVSAVSHQSCHLTLSKSTHSSTSSATTPQTYHRLFSPPSPVRPHPPTMPHRPRAQSTRMIRTCAEPQTKIPPRLHPPPLSKRSHLLLLSFERARTRTGVNVNQSPNADQKGVSLDNERIVYERITCGETAGKVGTGAVRCSNVRSSGTASSGKYTCCTSRHSSSRVGEGGAALNTPDRCK